LNRLFVRSSHDAFQVRCPDFKKAAQLSPGDNAFAVPTGSLTINGGTGNDTVNLNADITFVADNYLEVDLQDDDGTPGIDQIHVGTNANLVLSGTGAATLKASRNITLASGSRIETVNGMITLEANQQATQTAGNFVGLAANNATIQTTGTGNSDWAWPSRRFCHRS
jgi:hypothetical protein